MIKKFISFLTILTILTGVSTPPTAHAQEIQACKEAVVRSLESTMGTASSNTYSGYFKQLSDLMSTNITSHLLIDEVQQLARDARIELKGICQEVQHFNTMDPLYVRAYDLDACKAINVNAGDTGNQLEISNFCEDRSDALLDNFLDSLRLYLLKQAIRTSVEPLVQRMRSLNARLTVLLSEYGRVVNNFYTFDFRLGDTITGQRD